MLREEIRKAPLLRALIPLTAGIIFSRCMACWEFYPATGIVLLCIPLLILLTLYQGRVDPGFNRFYGLLVQLVFFIAGIYSLPGNESPEDIPYTVFMGRICSDVVERQRSFRLTMDRISFYEDTLLIAMEGKAEVYIRKDSLCAGLQPGMRLLMKGRLNAYDPSAAQEGFDYAAYLAGKGILYTTFIDSLSWRVVEAEEWPPGWMAERESRWMSGPDISPGIKALNLRRAMSQLLAGKLPPGTGEEGAILSSLLLGYRGGLPDDLNEQFRRSGSMHILAISGLHVGILYFLPFMMIRKIRRPLSLRAFLSVVLLVFLWAYALLVGMSPSVSRAAGMCTIYGLAGFSNRRVSMVQVMSLAALVMILVRPAMIFEAGFQLSFLALTGIAMFYQRLYGLFTFNRIITIPGIILKWAWRMTSLSLSAQIGTAPLVIYHFGQYPAYSLLSNLVVVPLTMLILYNGILFFGLLWVPSLTGILSFTLYKLACMLNEFTALVARFPGAMLPGTPWATGGLTELWFPGISILQVLLVYSLIFFTWLFLEKKNTFSLMAILFSIFLILCS